MAEEAGAIPEEPLAAGTSGGISGGDTLAAESSDAFNVPARRKVKKPGAKWDGRASSLSLKEYRERKWGIDAAFNNVSRCGPKYTMRPALPDFSRAASNPSLPIDPAAAFDRTRRMGPSITMSPAPFSSLPPDRSPGPAHTVPSAFGSKRHPTIAKHTGAKIGTERLLVEDKPGPAPGDYDHNAFKKSGRIPRMPNYTMQGREAWKPRTEAPGPCPGEYPTDHCSRVGKNTPLRFTMQGKSEPPAQPRGSQRLANNPGPGHYASPGNPGAINEHCASHKPPEWGFGSLPRGLG